MRGGSGAIRFIYILLTGAGICLAAPLNTVRAIKQLTIEDAHRNLPVRLTGVVTNVVPEWGGFSLQDATEGIYIAWSGAVADLRLGQRVEIEGRAMPGNFAPLINADRVRAIGQGAMPAPEKVTWQRFSTGACDNTYVEVEGVVRTTGILWSPEPALSMRLDVGGNPVRADVRDPGTPPARLVDALVRVRGVCRVISNSKGQFIGASLSAARPDEVVVEKPGPIDPFDSPLRPMERLFGYRDEVGFEHRTRVQGIATAGTPGGIYIQDGVNGMLVQTGSAPDIRPGDRVEAVGFPTVGSFSAELADALARVTGHGAEPRPIEVQANAVLQRASHAPAAPDGVLVRIAANVLERAANGQEEVLLLEDGATTFSARVPSRPKVRLLANVRPGSRVTVTGVCVVHTNQQGPRTFDVLLRSSADVTTIARAPMTRAAAMRLAGALLGLLITGAIWLELLRRRVGKQTETIRAQFQREAALEQRYAELVENASDAVYVRDLEGRLLQVNRGMAELTGYSHGELIGMNVVDLLIPEDKERGGDHLSPAPEEEVSASEWRIRTKQGREITVEIKHRCLMEDGRPVLVECIGRDVTARTEAHTAAVRERRRLQEQLHQSQKMEGIGLLAGGVAHDFNNLLTVISGYAQMATEQIPPPHAAREAIGEIAQAAERAAALTRQLLTFSRRQMSSPKIFSLNEVVANLDRMLRRLIGEDIALSLDLAAATGTIKADPAHIEQVIMNLVLNARDAMPDGGAVAVATKDIATGASEGLPAGAYVELTVTDTGAGMSDDVRQRIFEPFFTTKEKGKGTGLGLSTVYGIVKQSGGAISVASEPGRGSTFRILLPAVEGARDAEPPAAVGTGSARGSGTILLAEDEDGVRRFVGGVLRLNGYTVLEAGTGREALEVSRRHGGAIDLLVTDLVMPEMGGVELADRFAGERPGVPVLMMSGYADRPLSPEVEAALLSKPFTPGALLARVRQALAGNAANA